MGSRKMRSNRLKRRIVAGVLLLILGFYQIVGEQAYMPDTASASTASYQEDEYTSDIADYMESTMHQELRAYFSGSNGKKVKMTTISENDYKTRITFFLDPKKMSDITIDKILGFIYEITSKNPNFCTLSTSISWNSVSGELGVNSVIKKSKQAESIAEYKSFLADIERVPMEAENMSDVEILLYLHDMLIQQANYASNLKKKKIFIPHTMSTTGTVVCQSYAAVLNTMMKDLGFTCYILTSDSHEWNVVKLDGKWTCIDATWDDPVGYEADNVSHDFFLVKSSSFKKSHTVESFYDYRMKKITSKSDNAVSILPKSDKVSRPVCYKSGIWFYTDGGVLYRWDGVSQKADIESEVPEDIFRCVGVMEGTVYIGGTDGLWSYDPEKRVMKKEVENVQVEGLYYFGKTLYYLADGQWEVCAVARQPYTSYEMLNGTLTNLYVNLAVPTKPTISVMKSSAKSIRVTVTGRSQNSTGSYQVQYSTDKNFTYYSKKTFTGLRTSITGLVKGVKYYVRVRGINKRDTYLKKYGTWSKVKKA